MSEIVKPGPWQLLFVVVDRESGLLSYLTSNGLDKVVTIEPKNEHDKQKVRIDVFSVCINDTVPTTVAC